MTAMLAALMLALSAVTAQAAALALTDAQKSEALRVGERSVAADGFDREWRVSNGSGETVTVLTPFHRVALAARQAAFKREPLKPAEPDRLLREQAHRLVLAVELRGRGEDFARLYQPRLVTDGRQIKPAFVQNEHTAARQEDGRFLARCVYTFPTKDLTGTSRVALVVADADGRDVRTFTIDLAAMR